MKRSTASWLSLCVALSSTLVETDAHADDLSTALYTRVDSDHTTVISPRVRASRQLSENTRIDATYAADVWTSASIDIRTSASVRPVSEQRDEIDLALSHDIDDWTLRSAYRFSTEHDYTSHGLTLGAAHSFANNAATLDANLRAIADSVGRSGDPHFSREVGTFNASLDFTQVLDPHMFTTLSYELAHAQGYQSSPYRVVGIGGNGYGCEGANLCLQERVPSGRTRHAFAGLLRRALSESVSIAATYRLYIDDWSLLSHTLLGELGFDLSSDTLLMLRYRYYTQSSARFYRRVYETLDTDQLRTRDRELSALSYQRAGVELEHGFALTGGGRITATFIVSGNLYRYPDFVGLDHILALEVSAALMLEI
ncbi:MAG TPA: DUF3570 domain-containing protein [Polyangiales bacterium]|nr:DUF3570 domain-containing protein [Polyangiales bacterium]